MTLIPSTADRSVKLPVSHGAVACQTMSERNTNPYNGRRTLAAGNDSNVVTTPIEVAYIHILRGCGLSQQQIADMVAPSRETVRVKLNKTRERIEEGEDPIDVWEEIMAPLWEQHE